MKRIFLIFHGRFPSEKAASLFAAKECEAFGENGLSVTLLVPRRLGRVKVDPSAYYHLKKNFNIVYVPTIDIFGFPFFTHLVFNISFFVFSVFCFLYLFFKAHKEDLICSTESLPIILATFYFPHTLYELHDFPQGNTFFYRLLFRRVTCLLVTNTWKVEEAVRLFGIPREKILPERNAVEVSDFDIPMSKEEAREELGLPREKKIVVYTGHLYSWKGVDTLARAARELSNEYLVIFVGGTAEDLKRFREIYGKIPNILIPGWKPHAEIPVWQKAADVLVLPNTATEDISKYYTSPMKLFEYMASRRPIVAADIPSIREIANDENAIIVSPDNPEVLAKGIQIALENKDLVEKMTEKAYTDVLFHTWSKRADRIFKFVNTKVIV